MRRRSSPACPIAWNGTPRFCSTCAFSEACLSQGYDKSALADLHDRALDTRARDTIDAVPPKRKHSEPEASVGRKRAQSIG